jgi:tripartite-type tricarboxylate transporter receptor subunit TctC
MKRREFLALALASPAVFRSTAAPADDRYPSRMIRVIVPFAAGGTSSVIVRYITEKLSVALGQPIVVENRVGANGTVGLAQGLRADPDGYTLIQVSNTNTVAAIQMVRNLPFDPLTDMAGVGSIYQIPTVELAAKNFPANSFTEFVKIIRENPDRYPYAYSHATGAAVGASVALAAKLKMNVVPYSSGPQAINDVLGGHMPIMFTDVAAALPLLQAEQLKVFAISSAQRSKLLPDLPTFTELLPVPVEFVGWGGFVAPPKTPAAILNKLNTAMNKILDDEAAGKFLNGLGAELMTSSPAGFDAFIAKEAPLWVAALKAAEIGPQ